MQEQMTQKTADVAAPKADKKATKDPKDMLKKVKDLVDATCTTELDREDTINLAYFKGRQWISWDKYKNQVWEPPQEPKKTQHTENRLSPLVQHQLARVQRNHWIMDAIPASSEVADIESARVSKKIAEWLEYDKKLAEVDETSLLWGLVTRIVFIQPYWNPSLGPLATPDGEHEGDIDYDILSCFEVKYDPSATSWRDVRWLRKSRVRDIDYVEQVYGKKVKPEKGLSANNIYDAKMSFASLNDNIKHVPLEHHVRVHEFWELPCSEYQNGRRVTYTDNHDEPLFVKDDIGFGPQDDTERVLPFFPFVAIRLPGCVHGTNKYTQCRPIQREINRTRSQIIDNKDLTAYPQLVVENGSMEEDWDNEIGGVKYYTPGSKPPAYLQPPMAGADAYQNLTQLYEAFDYVSGISQASTGRMPADASGYMMQLAIEQDDTQFAPTIENWIRCKQGYMSYSLKMLHFNYKSERKLRIVGRDNVEVLPISGASIKTWDVRLQRGSLLASSMVAQRAEIMNLINAGVLNPVEHRDEILGRLEFGKIDDMYKEAEQDRAQARKESMLWERGIIEQDPNKAVRDFFNHQVHIKEHNRWRKSEVYESLDEEKRGMIDMHVMFHEMLLQEQQIKQMMAQMPPGEEEDGSIESMGTPHNPENLEESIMSGEVVGNSMQGRPDTGGMPSGQEGL
jgi:hypothetical protein